jgi:hypothetical protein
MGKNPFQRVGQLLMIEMQNNNHFTVTRQKSLKENQNWKVPPHAECSSSSPDDIITSDKNFSIINFQINLNKIER